MRIRIVGKKQINYFFLLAEHLESKFSGDTHIRIYKYIYIYTYTHIYMYVYKCIIQICCTIRDTCKKTQNSVGTQKWTGTIRIHGSHLDATPSIER